MAKAAGKESQEIRQVDVDGCMKRGTCLLWKKADSDCVRGSAVVGGRGGQAVHDRSPKLLTPCVRAVWCARRGATLYHRYMHDAKFQVFGTFHNFVREVTPGLPALGKGWAGTLRVYTRACEKPTTKSATAHSAVTTQLPD